MADQYYIEQDYFDGKYFGVIFDAVISLNPYIEEGYYDGDYYVPTGGQATLTCSAEVVTGVTVEANGSPTSNFTLTFYITRIKPLSATLTAQASVTTLASKLNDIDIYAFAEGQLSSSVGAIRDYEIAASSQFSISIDYVRRRQADSDSDIVTSISIDNERYREFDSAQQVAFSFAVAETKFRPASADLTASTALSAIISNIAGADIVAENFASISCDAVKTVDAGSQFETVASLTAAVGKNVISSAQLQSHAVLFVSRNAYHNRPLELDGSPTQSATYKKYGDGSFRANTGITIRTKNYPIDIRVTDTDTFCVEGWLFRTGGTSAAWEYFIALGADGTSGTTVGDNQWALGISSRNVNTQTFRRWRLLAKTSSGTTNIIDGPESSSLSYPISYTASHLAVVRDSNLYLKFYLNGTEILSGYHPTFGTTTNYSIRYQGSSSTSYNYWDELSYRKGASNILGLSNVITPDQYQVFLFHGDNVGTSTIEDDTSNLTLTQITSAGLVTTASLTATLSGTQEFATLQASQATLTADIGVTRQGDSSLVLEATQTTQADRIRTTDVAVTSEFTQSASADRTRTDSANLNSEATLSFAIGIIKTADIDTDAVATQLTAVGRIGDFFINCESQFTQSTTVVKTTDVISTQSSEFTQTADGIIEVSAEADLTATATQTTDGARIRFGVSDIVEDSSAVIADVNYIADAEAGIEFDVIASTEITTQGLIGIECDVVITATIEITAVKTTDVDSSLDAVSNFNTSADRLRTTETVLESEFTSSADAGAVRDVAITTDAIATQLSAVAKIADFFINAESQFVLNIDAVKTVDIQSAQDAIATQETLAFKLHSTAESDLLSEFTQVSVGFVGAVGNADFTVLTTLQSSAVATFDAVGSLTVIAALECDIGIIRAAASLTFAFGDVFLEANRLRGIELTATALSSLNCSVNAIFNNEVIVNGAMTATIVIRAIHIDMFVYKIPGETRVYQISSETRNWKIKGETRRYTIRR